MGGETHEGQFDARIQSLSAAQGGRTASLKNIHAHYLDLVRKYPLETHADQFEKIREAYDMLSDNEKRYQYDDRLSGRADQLQETEEQGIDFINKEATDSCAGGGQRLAGTGAFGLPSAGLPSLRQVGGPCAGP